MVLAYKKSERSSSACRRNCRGSNFFPYMSGRKNLRNLGRITLRTGGEVLENKVQQVLEIVGLENRADDKVGTYSLGMKQRLGIAQALLGNPDFIILDEPSNGLDPVGIKQLRKIVLDLQREKGITFSFLAI